LLLMVFSSYYMWYRFKRNNHMLGWLALGAGTLGCGIFVFGLAWI
jgi:hypothetical protein